MVYVKNYILKAYNLKSSDWNPSVCACNIDKYFKSIIVNLVVICDGITVAIIRSYNNPRK